MCWAGAVWQISVRCPQFCCEPKSALKNSLNIKIKDIHTHTHIYICIRKLLMKYIMIHSETPNEFTWCKFFNIQFVLIQWHTIIL